MNPSHLAAVDRVADQLSRVDLRAVDRPFVVIGLTFDDVVGWLPLDRFEEACRALGYEDVPFDCLRVAAPDIPVAIFGEGPPSLHRLRPELLSPGGTA